MIRAANASCIWGSTVSIAVMPLFVLALGGNALHVGLLATLQQVSPLSQIAGLRLMRRLGKARMIARWSLAAIPFMGALVGLALVNQAGGTQVALAVAAFGVCSFVLAVGITGWWPLLQDVTADEPKGAFFLRLRMRLRIAEVVVPILVGGYLGQHPAVSRFALPLAAGTLALVVLAWFVRRVPERRYAPPEAGLLIRLRLAAKGVALRRYLAFLGAYFFLLYLALPFWLVMLKKQRGLPSNFVVWLTTATAVGHVAGLYLWARLVDRHGSRSVLSFAVAGASTLGLAWLFLPEGGTLLVVWAMAFYLAWGFLEGAAMMGRTWTMLQAVPEVYQADGFTLITLVQSGAAALGSLVGAFAFQSLTRHPFGTKLHGLEIYLAAVQVALVATWWFKGRLSGFDRQTPARELMGAVMRRVLFWETTPER